MASAAELTVLFKGDTSGLDGATGKATGLIGGLVGGLGKLGLAGMGFGVIKDAASAIIGPIGDGIKAAEGLGDAMARSEGVFGPASQSIVDAASSQANALGLTKEAYIATAAKTGDLITSMGIGGDKAAEMASSFADLAPKLAAYTGMDVESANAALTKGLTGATKGLKEMGIVVGDIPKGLDDAAQAQFVYDAVLAQSGEAQKAWAGNSGDVETSMARVSAAMTDAKAAIGEKLLPIIAPLAEKFAALATNLVSKVGPAIDQISKFLAPIAEEFKAAFADAGGGMDGVVAIIDTLLEKLGLISAGDAGAAFQAIKAALASIDWQAIGSAVMGFVGAFKDGLMVVLPIVAAIFRDVLMPVFSTVFGFLMEHKGVLVAIGALLLALTGPVGLVVVAFTALGALGPKIGEWVTAIGTGLVSGIGSFIGAVVGAITSVVDAIIDTFKSLLGIASPSTVFDGFGTDLLQGLIDGVSNMIANVSAIFGTLGTAIFDKWLEIKENVLATVEIIRVMISAKWDAIKEYLSGVLAAVGKVVSDAWEAVTTTIKTALATALETATRVWGSIFDAIDSALAKVRGVLDTVMTFIETKTGISMDAARRVVDEVMTAIGGFFDSMKVVVSTVIGAVADLLTGDFSGAVDGMKRAAETGLKAVMGLFSGLGRAIMDAIGRAGDLLVQVGSDLIEGLKRGISKGWDTLKAWMSGLFGDLVTLAKKILGIASPSKVMADEVGQPIAMGIVEGIRMTLAAHPIDGLVAGWAQASSGASIGAALGASLKAAVVAGLMLSGRADGGWGVSAKAADGRTGMQKGGGITDSADDGRVRADAFRSGRGGLLAASSSNYWQVFVQRFGIPTESSARKVSAQLGIKIPQWLEDIFHPAQGETVDRPDVAKTPEAALEAGAALKQMAGAAYDAGTALSKLMPVAIDLDALRGSVIKAAAGFADLILKVGRAVPLPPGSGGGIGGPIIPGPPGGATTFGAGSSGVLVMADRVDAKTATLGEIGLALELKLDGVSLPAVLTAAYQRDTASLDKLIKIIDQRRQAGP